ncbi:hypothetical protein Glove_346g165 [Diversispora epigaea]|uniref:Uncharacterized protein n=1 Tax=Diversispora epigaea TaxID=1348612 RepID=A0A397HFC1_9GLOM|nr:hypothetical protein Glove_346g165 [Diversispora epigaea]
MEIGDLSKEESIEYLIGKHKIKKEEAERLHELVGAVANDHLAGQSFEITKRQTLTKVKKKFDNECDEVLEVNVFAYHPSKDTVTFQSESVESCIKADADKFGVKLIDFTPTGEGDV